MDRKARVYRGCYNLKKNEKIKRSKAISLGKQIKKNWILAANKNEIKISVSGLDSLPNFNSIMKTRNFNFFYTEMLKLGFLAKEALAMTYVYNNKIIKKYLKSVELVFGKINYYHRNKLKLPIKGHKHSTLKRITF